MHEYMVNFKEHRNTEISELQNDSLYFLASNKSYGKLQKLRKERENK